MVKAIKTGNDEYTIVKNKSLDEKFIIKAMSSWKYGKVQGFVTLCNANKLTLRVDQKLIGKVAILKLFIVDDLEGEITNAKKKL